VRVVLLEVVLLLVKSTVVGLKWGHGKTRLRRDFVVVLGRLLVLQLVLLVHLTGLQLHSLAVYNSLSRFDAHITFLTSGHFATTNPLWVNVYWLVGLLFVEGLHVKVEASLWELRKAASIVWDFKGLGKGRALVLLPVVALTAYRVVARLHCINAWVILNACSSLVCDVSHFATAVSHFVNLGCALVPLVEETSAVDGVTLLHIFEKLGVIFVVFLAYLMVRVFHCDIIMSSSWVFKVHIRSSRNILLLVDVLVLSRPVSTADLILVAWYKGLDLSWCGLASIY